MMITTLAQIEQMGACQVSSGGQVSFDKNPQLHAQHSPFHQVLFDIDNHIDIHHYFLPVFFLI